MAQEHEISLSSHLIRINGSENEAITQQTDDVFRLLVDSVKDYAIFLLSPDGTVASWNQGAQSIKGYSAKEIIGKHFSCFYPREAAESKWPERELEIAAKEGSLRTKGFA